MKNFLPLLLCLLTVCLTQAQVPTRFRAANRVTANGMFDAPGLAPERILYGLNLRAIQQADKAEEGKGFPFKFGENIQVAVTPEDAGRWVNIDNARVWKFKITSKGAYSLNLYFDQFKLSDNSELYIYNSEGSMVMGPITSRENTPSNTFGTSIFKGESVIVELKEPLNNPEKSLLRLARVTHGYKNLFAKLYGDSGDCNIDVLCPDGNGWGSERAGVAMVLLGNGTRLCSSALLNNTNNDRTPYILTAFHCADTNPRNQIIEPAERTAAESWQFIFQYWSPSCNGPNGSTSLTFQQATWRAAWAASDFALLQLNNNISSNFCNFSFLGWSRSTTAASSAVSIHHPAGDVMKITFDNNPVQRVDNNTIGAPGTRHWVVNWDRGVTEPGSSGSPLFDQHRRVIGQLSGGPSGCNRADLRDGYGRIDASWEGGGSSGTRLKDWLDPSNSGAASTNTIPSINVAIAGPNVVCTSGASFALQNVPAGATVTWTASSNLTPASGSGTTATVSAVSGASGNGSVTFTINACTSFTVSRNVTVGLIPSDQVKIYPRGSSTPVTSTIWAAPGTMHSFEAPYFANASYEWKIVYPSPGYVIGSNSRYLDFQMFDTQNKVITIILTVTNACGTSGGYSLNFTNRMSYYSVYPNPAVDEVTIETAENGPAPEAVSASGSRDSHQGAPKQFDVTLYDKYAKVRRTGKTQNGKLTLPLADLPEGLYQIRITHPRGAETKSLLIKH